MSLLLDSTLSRFFFLYNLHRLLIPSIIISRWNKKGTPFKKHLDPIQTHPNNGWISLPGANRSDKIFTCSDGPETSLIVRALSFSCDRLRAFQGIAGHNRSPHRRKDSSMKITERDQHRRSIRAFVAAVSHRTMRECGTDSDWVGTISARGHLCLGIKA